MVEAADLARQRTIDLSTFGRRSGTWRRVEIWWFYFEDRLIVTGTPGPRDWLANLRADPKLIIHAPEGDFPGEAVVVDDLDYRRRFFESRQTRWYVNQAGLEALVAHAPMVEVNLA
ncbi:MAG: nitroreductase/quinone reductase family protein [Acidimicrobiia bacterium]